MHIFYTTCKLVALLSATLVVNAADDHAEMMHRALFLTKQAHLIAEALDGVVESIGKSRRR